MRSRRVHIVITGQLRRGEFLADAIRSVSDSNQDLELAWTVATWTPELSDKVALQEELKGLGVRVVAGPPPPLWGRSTAVPQLLALSNGLIGREASELTIRTRTDALTTRGIDPFLDCFREAPSIVASRIVVERMSINVPFFATDFQFMGTNAQLTELSVLDATVLSRGLNIHPEQYYFAPVLAPSSAYSFWRRINVGTIFGNDTANDDWAAVRLSSPLYAAVLAEYFRHAAANWWVLPDPESTDAPTEALRSIDDLLFSAADPRVRFDPYNYVATTCDLSLVSEIELRARPRTDFGDFLLQFIAEPPTVEQLVTMTGAEVDRLASVPSLVEYRRDMSRFTAREVDFTALPHDGADVTAAERVRTLEAENSLLRSRLTGEAEVAERLGQAGLWVDRVADWAVWSPEPGQSSEEIGLVFEAACSPGIPEAPDAIVNAVEALVDASTARVFMRVRGVADEVLGPLAERARDRGWFLVMPMSRAVGLAVPPEGVFAEVSEYERVPDWLPLAGLVLHSIHSDWWLSDDRLAAINVGAIAMASSGNSPHFEGWAAAMDTRGVRVFFRPEAE